MDERFAHSDSDMEMSVEARKRSRIVGVLMMLAISFSMVALGFGSQMAYGVTVDEQGDVCGHVSVGLTEHFCGACSLKHSGIHAHDLSDLPGAKGFHGLHDGPYAAFCSSPVHQSSVVVAKAGAKNNPAKSLRTNELRSTPADLTDCLDLEPAATLQNEQKRGKDDGIVLEPLEGGGDGNANDNGSFSGDLTAASPGSPDSGGASDTIRLLSSQHEADAAATLSQCELARGHTPDASNSNTATIAATRAHTAPVASAFSAYQTTIVKRSQSTLDSGRFLVMEGIANEGSLRA